MLAKQSKCSQVDEATLPYFGRNSSKQRIQNQSVLLDVAESTGYVMHFYPNQEGAKFSGPKRSSDQTWGLGEKTAMELLKVLSIGPSYHVVFFTSNCDSTALGVSVQRYCRDTKEWISVKQSQFTNSYNKSIDRADENTVLYRVLTRSNKWCLFTAFCLGTGTRHGNTKCFGIIPKV